MASVLALQGQRHLLSVLWVRRLTEHPVGHGASILLPAVLVVALGFANRAPTAPRGDGTRGQILLITLDTARADRFRFNSPDSGVEMPFLDGLAARSTVFRAAFSTAPLTSPAHTSMFSGLDVDRHGVVSNSQRLKHDLPWIPAQLAEDGWCTQAVVSTAVLAGRLGFQRGFDRYDSTLHHRWWLGNPVLNWFDTPSDKGLSHQRTGWATAGITEMLPACERRFTWVHLYDAHWPYEPDTEARRLAGVSPDAGIDEVFRAQPFRETDDAKVPDAGTSALGISLYDAQFHELDRILQRLVSSFPNDTTVIVVGDHGESLGEHDYWFRHGRLPYAPDTWVPLVVHVPGQPPRVVDSPVSVTDIGPTLLELAGLPIPPDLDGVSLMHPEPNRVVVSRSFRNILPFLPKSDPGAEVGRYGGVAIRAGSRSQVASSWAERANFDRRTDPLEIDGSTPVAGDLSRRFERAAQSRPQPDVPVADPELDEALEVLGYVD